MSLENTRRVVAGPSDQPPPAKVRGTFLLPRDVLEQLRDASYWARESLTKIAERALRRELRKMKQEHNEGEEFQRRPAA